MIRSVVRYACILFAIAGLAAVLPLSAAAQTADEAPRRGAVAGTVVDGEGTPVEGVQVVDLTLQRGTTTGADGTYRIDRLPAGGHVLEFRFV